jgi:hypothetical protein
LPLRLNPQVGPLVVSEVRVRVLNYIALVAVHIAIVRVVIVVVIVVDVVVLVRVLDAVGVRMDVQMRWLGCVVATRHKNLGTARLISVQFLDGALGPRCSARRTVRRGPPVRMAEWRRPRRDDPLVGFCSRCVERPRIVRAPLFVVEGGIAAALDVRNGLSARFMCTFIDSR